MAKTKVMLDHYSHLKDCKGEPGDVIEVESAVADRWVRQRGARRLDAKGNAIPHRRPKREVIK